MVELAKQLADANKASIKVKTLLDLALASVDEQKKKVEELLKRAEENDKRLQDFLTIQEEDKLSKEVVECAANELQMVLYV